MPVKQPPPELDRYMQDFLADMITTMKALHGTVMAVMIDIAALRQAMLCDPEEFTCYKEKLREEIETTKPIFEAAMRSYDEMIQGISGSKVWNN
ncbi:MAG TPA: hypothetical protein VOA41_10315 [Candidatus Dormibacteraeota bacterium]|nr:hypothetical protein [Candidatus Dormibacteraeota bacterium]